MKGIVRHALGLFEGAVSSKLAFESENEAHLAVEDKDEFLKAALILSKEGFSLTCLFCVEGFRKGSDASLLYFFEKAGFSDFLAIVRPVSYSGKEKPSSVARIFPSASWYEREVSDGFGIQFDESFDKRRLFLHEIYPDGFHPLRKSFKGGKIRFNTRPKGIEEAYKFRHIHGEGVYSIPVGPVHAGIIEPGHFRFSVIGETIFNLEVRMFWKHRGLEKLSEGKTPLECMPIAEAISGDETVANSTAFCLAVERISGTRVPKRAEELRTVFLELERVYSLLGDLAGMVVDVAFPVGAGPFFILREEIFRKNLELSGSRFLRGTVVPGGVSRDLDSDSLERLGKYAKSFLERFDQSVSFVLKNPGVMDRFEGTGIVRKDLVAPLHLTGPIARSSGVAVDTRRDHPYGTYSSSGAHIGIGRTGDVLDRFSGKAAEIRNSMELIQGISRTLPGGKVLSPPRNLRGKDGFSFQAVESARGQNVCFVRILNGKVDRYKVRTASFCNWQSIQHAVLGNIVPDFPLINKSMNLSYAGTDL